MKTALISDLHLGVASNADVLRRAPIRSLLLERLEDTERLVLLGDTIELRDRPIADALAAARPFFEDVGRVFAGKTVVLVPGNHDHRLLGPWLDSRTADEEAQIDLAELVSAPSPAVELIAGWLGEARLEVRYPGVWVRDDVYAMHGHYADSHLTLPTIERLSVAMVERLRREPHPGRRNPADYEHVHAPLYDMLFDLAQGVRPASSWTSNRQPSFRLWELMGGPSGRPSTVRGRMLRSIAVPVGLELLSRTRVGRFGRDFSLAEIGRAGVAAMHEVIASLQIDAAHVIFGHIHRRGPLPGEEVDLPRHPPWQRAGVQLHNPGNWIYDRGMLSGASPTSPFWPGGMIEVTGDAAPLRVDLLANHGHPELGSAA